MASTAKISHNVNGEEVQISDSEIVLIVEDELKANYHILYSRASDSNTSQDLNTLTIPKAGLPESFISKHVLHQLPPQLSLPPSDLYVVISTGSGTGKAEAYFQAVLKPVLDATGIKESGYTVITTNSENSIKDFTAETLLPKADKGIRQTLLLLSGDGGIVDIVNTILGVHSRSKEYIRPAIALFPLGTGNALYSSIHRNPDVSDPGNAPSDVVIALRSLLQGTERPLPSFSVTFSSASVLSNEGQTATPIASNRVFGAVVASYGFHSTLVADSDTAEYRKHGAQRFHMVATELLKPSDGGPPHAYKAKLTFRLENGKEEVIPRTEHGYILATFVSNLEKTFTISPWSKPLEGNLRVVHFGPVPADKVMQIMGDAYQAGKHVPDPEGVVGYDEVESLRIDFLEPGEDGRWRRVCVDGLIVKVDEGGWAEVSKIKDEAVNVLL